MRRLTTRPRPSLSATISINIFVQSSDRKGAAIALEYSAGVWPSMQYNAILAWHRGRVTRQIAIGAVLSPPSSFCIWFTTDIF